MVINEPVYLSSAKSINKKKQSIEKKRRGGFPKESRVTTKGLSKKKEKS